MFIWKGRVGQPLTLWNWLFAVTATDADSVDNVALLGLVSQTTSLVRARRARCTMHDFQLAVLPASRVRIQQLSPLMYHKHQDSPDTEEETQHIGLLFSVQLADVFVCAHVAGCNAR
jgi:hypothetical protein